VVGSTYTRFGGRVATNRSRFSPLDPVREAEFKAPQYRALTLSGMSKTACLTCDRISHNPNDVHELYRGHCDRSDNPTILVSFRV
jgi:hypothetical protein